MSDQSKLSRSSAFKVFAIFLVGLLLAFIWTHFSDRQSGSFDSRSESAHLAAASEQIDRGEFKEARSHIDEVLFRLNPKNAEAWKLKALVAKLEELPGDEQRQTYLLDYRTEEIQGLLKNLHPRSESLDTRREAFQLELEAKYKISRWFKKWQAQKIESPTSIDEDEALGNAFKLEGQERFHYYESLLEKFPLSADIAFHYLKWSQVMIRFNFKEMPSEVSERYHYSAGYQALLSQVIQTAKHIEKKFSDDLRIKVYVDQLGGLQAALSTEQKDAALSNLEEYAYALDSKLTDLEIAESTNSTAE